MTSHVYQSALSCKVEAFDRILGIELDWKEKEQKDKLAQLFLFFIHSKLLTFMLNINYLMSLKSKNY